MEIRKESVLHQIQQAKLGKQSAFKFLLDHYWNEVFGFQLKRVNNEYEAEDISIETFAKAFDKIESFNETYTFSTWLVAISKNIQIDKSRKKNALLYAHVTDTSEEHLQKIVDHAPSPEDKLIGEQNLAELLRFIKQLKTPYQEVINLRYFNEMSYKEISEALDEPLNNIKVRLLRARKLLAEIITEKRKN
ncbi:RNA polymerase sigma factor [Cochleicola gelatinilyticus]|uniref:RNA polymerase subunit sigma-70 n=1 Tax=Cochleicola gelatinilyticus TaxID=1763537 RepID=A0A167F4E9_9FLAO|nr:sigma-70 family RNA polymerase sigma factor [Cochleicola gelatinilyticus]OAB76180.1 RNA polymerase subunit sigma-70 [Cochleicola gelatinilyticus]